MELKQGYKMSEIGEIPSDWKVYELNDILHRIADVDHYMPKTENFGFPYVMTGDLSERVSDIDFASCKQISLESYNKLSKKIKNIKGDIILARYATVGTVSYVDIQCEFIVSYSCVTIKPNTSKVLGMFLFNYFKSHIFKNEVRNKVNANIQDNVGIGDLLKMQIPLPPLQEQTAIANSLSDMDALISQTEKLIEKKKAIKQGAMQELLNPKEGWVTQRLGDIGKTYGGLTGKSKVDFANGNAFYIPFMNVMSSPTINLNFFDSVYIRSGEKQNKALKGDLFFNGSSETPEEVGMCSVLTQQIDNLYLNSFCFGYRLNDTETYNGLFLAYYFRSDFGRAAIFSLAQGATRYNLSKGNFLKMEIPIPEFNIQNEIAGCIADMDSELKKITIKLTKLKQQKQGMMQALLTGKIRLVS
jgi:type I restriction enzyme S subunit